MPMAENGLAKLIEELGELQQVCGKKLAAGKRDDHPDGRGSLKIRLQDEIADVIAACEFVMYSHNLDVEAILGDALLVLSWNKVDPDPNKGLELLQLTLAAGLLTQSSVMRIRANLEDADTEQDEGMMTLLQNRISSTLAACDLVILAQCLSEEQVKARAQTKFNLFKQWHNDPLNMVNHEPD